jgi:toxin CcdB
VFAQYDLYHTAADELVVIVQSDMLEHLRSRVVLPLVPRDGLGPLPATLAPQVMLGDATYLIATMLNTELGTRIGSLAVYRDEITRAMDTLFSGI